LNKSSYISPKVEAREVPEKGGRGCFTTVPIASGEVIAVWGGVIVTLQQLNELPDDMQHRSIQIEEEFYLAPPEQAEVADYVNHSCNPNAGLRGQVVLVAMRDIPSSEEICFDYAMSDGGSYDEFECKCGSPSCRKFIRGDDWSRSDLWERYDGYFSPYLQIRIDKLRASDKMPIARSTNGNGHRG
jgi:SET domain-containing protein